MAEAIAIGVVRGNTITLDEALPELDGKRVRVTVASEARELELSADEQAGLWNEWIRQGPQGAIGEE